MRDLNKNSIVVKILANENISLVVQEGLPTASFDLKNRVVRVPNYMFDDDDFTTMVLAHEVGHCLYTPYDGWFDFLKQVEKDTTLDDRQKSAAKSAMNIIEDVRIDKFMQRRYSGLVKYYKRSCKWITENDFFKITEKKKDLNKMSFLNRLCVYAKCDSRSSLYAYGVKFTAEEQTYVDRIFAADTFDEVLKLSLEVIKKFPLFDEIDSLDDQIEEEDEGEGKGNAEGDSENFAPGRYNVHDELMDKGAGGDKDTPNNVTAGGLNGENQSLYDLWEQSVVPKANVAVSNSYLNKTGTKILNEMKDFATVDFATGRRTPVTLDKVSDLSREFNKYVNLFATKFNQRKRARQLINNFERDTGRVDPLKLFKYKYDDNIFTKNVIENYQKNHGFMFLIDCSSSMSEVFKSLSLQLFAFYKICDRIDVPFVAYGYTDEYTYDRNTHKRQETNFGSNLKYYKFFEKGDSKKDIFQNIAKMIAGDVSMGGTPTSDALLGLVPEIKRFKHAFFPDITNVIVVTDGSDGTGMQSSSLSFNGALYMNKFSPRGVVDNNAAIYSLMRDFYDVRIFHMDITDHVPDSFLSMDETKSFQRNKFLSKKDFGGADNVLWLSESLIQAKSTKVIDSLVNILA